MTLLILLDEEASSSSGGSAARIDVVSTDVLRISFVDDAVVDAAYLDANNYSITPLVPGDVVPSVRAVLQPVSDVATSEVFLHLDKPTDGGTYLITFSGINDRSGGNLEVLDSDNVTFIARRTKTDSICSSIPNHFDLRPQSVLRTILTAISLSDDLIGGSKDEPNS